MPCNCELMKAVKEIVAGAIASIADVADMCEYLNVCDLTQIKLADRVSGIFGVLAHVTADVNIKLDDIQTLLKN